MMGKKRRKGKDLNQLTSISDFKNKVPLFTTCIYWIQTSTYYPINLDPYRELE